jgi:oligosaccharide repeat unit polymerase
MLLFAYVSASLRVMRFSVGLNLITGWMAGVGYFAVAPLALLTVAGVYRLPGKYDVGQNWGVADLTNAAYLLAYLMVWTALMLMCAAVWLGVGRKAKSAKPQSMDLRKPLERVLGIAMAMLALEWVLMIRLAGGLQDFLVSHWYERYETVAAQYGDRFVLLSHWMQASDIIFLSAAALYTSLSLRFGNSKKKYIVLTLLFLVLQMVMTGNRIYIAIYLLAFLVSCCLFKKKKALIVIFAASPALLLIFNAWAMVRHDLTSIPDSISDFSSAQEDSLAVSSLMDATEGLDFLLLLHIVQDYGSRRDFLYGETYLKTITAWVPRSLYPTKTENFTVLLAKEYLPNQETSLNATVLGEMYANFGAFTLLVFPLLAITVVSADHWIEDHREAHPLFSALFFVLAVWAVRTAFADTVVLCLMCLFQMSLFRLEKILLAPPVNLTATTSGETL